MAATGTETLNRTRTVLATAAPSQTPRQRASTGVLRDASNDGQRSLPARSGSALEDHRQAWLARTRRNGSDWQQVGWPVELKRLAATTLRKADDDKRELVKAARAECRRLDLEYARPRAKSRSNGGIGR